MLQLIRHFYLAQHNKYQWALSMNDDHFFLYRVDSIQVLLYRPNTILFHADAKWGLRLKYMARCKYNELNPLHRPYFKNCYSLPIGTCLTSAVFSCLQTGSAGNNEFINTTCGGSTNQGVTVSRHRKK